MHVYISPYTDDAAAIKERMETEGHTPDVMTYTHLIKSCKGIYIYMYVCMYVCIYGN